MKDPVEDRAITLQAGDMVLYPTSALHWLEPLIEGERVAIIGWTTRCVRDPWRREILYDFDVAARSTFDTYGKTATFDRVFKV